MQGEKSEMVPKDVAYNGKYKLEFKKSIFYFHRGGTQGFHLGSVITIMLASVAIGGIAWSIKSRDTN